MRVSGEETWQKQIVAHPGEKICLSIARQNLGRTAFPYGVARPRCVSYAQILIARGAHHDTVAQTFLMFQLNVNQISVWSDALLLHRPYIIEPILLCLQTPFSIPHYFPPEIGVEVPFVTQKGTVPTGGLPFPASRVCSAAMSTARGIFPVPLAAAEAFAAAAGSAVPAASIALLGCSTPSLLQRDLRLSPSLRQRDLRLQPLPQ